MASNFENPEQSVQDVTPEQVKKDLSADSNGQPETPAAKPEHKPAEHKSPEHKSRTKAAVAEAKPAAEAKSAPEPKPAPAMEVPPPVEAAEAPKGRRGSQTC